MMRYIKSALVKNFSSSSCPHSGWTRRSISKSINGSLVSPT